ncbi:hypothetical protein BGZ74_000799 [Mortierella antarctica]|nr:hypothetical protein BGZ74_000799 [Mortierella antarctica]
MPSKAAEVATVEVVTKTCLYVPVEGDIKILPWTSFTAIKDILEWRDCEGIAFSSQYVLNQGYFLTGFIRTFGPDTDLVNKRCTKLYVANIYGPVVIVNENRKGDMVPLTEKDIPHIFN